MTYICDMENEKEKELFELFNRYMKNYWGESDDELTQEEYEKCSKLMTEFFGFN